MNEEFINFPPKDKSMPFFISLAGITYPNENYKITRPNSRCICVEYILEGEGCVICGGKKYYPKKGDAYILSPWKDHYYFSDSKNPWKKIWFNAEGELINNLLAIYNPSDEVLFQNCDIKEFIYRIFETGKSEELPPTEKHERSALIFHEMLQYIRGKTFPPEKSEESELLKNYISNSITKNITLKELSELVYLSESQVIRIFKRDFGKTPYDYIINLKLSRAKNLLINTNITVKEIAFSLGFSDEHYFSHIFKKKTGKTPSQFRKGV